MYIMALNFFAPQPVSILSAILLIVFVLRRINNEIQSWLVVHGSDAPRGNMKPSWRLTDSPPSSFTDMQSKYCVDYHNIYSIKNQYKGTHKIGGAAEGLASSFVVAAAGRHLCIGF